MEMDVTRRSFLEGAACSLAAGLAPARGVAAAKDGKFIKQLTAEDWEKINEKKNSIAQIAEVNTLHPEKSEDNAAVTELVKTQAKLIDAQAKQLETMQKGFEEMQKNMAKLMKKGGKKGGDAE